MMSKKVEEFVAQASWIRKMFEDGIKLKQKFGSDKVYDFTLGNPNVAPPAQFRATLESIVQKNIPGMHAYMPNAGYPETRSSVAGWLKKEHQVPIEADHVIMTCGAGGALNVILKALLDPGSEVIVPSPYFIEYRFYIDNHGGKMKLVPTRDDFSLDVEAIAGSLNKRTRVILINSPNNPTGKVYDEQSIRNLAKVIEDAQKKFVTDIYLVSDEPYRDITYDGVKVPSIFKVYSNSIIADSYSKSLSIPGERIGYIAVNPALTDRDRIIGGMILANRILGFVNAPALMQRVVSELQSVKADVRQYLRKRDLMCDGLTTLGYEFTKPQGAFYVFPKTPIEDDIEFVRQLQAKNVLTVPGTGFGRAGHFRIAYCVDDASIINSLEGFGEVMRKYRA